MMTMHTLKIATVQYSTVQYSTVQYSTVQYSTVQYSTVQYTTVHYSTVHYSTLQYTTVHNTTRHNTTQHGTYLIQVCPCRTTYVSVRLPLGSYPVYHCTAPWINYLNKPSNTMLSGKINVAIILRFFVM